jgi:hypothetical protein
MPAIHRGGSRCVLLLPFVVLKWPRWTSWREGVASNLQEGAWGAKRRPDLCPVVASSRRGWWLVMRRARPMTDEEWSATEERLYAAVFGDDDPYDGVPVELKRSNFGIYQGRPRRGGLRRASVTRRGSLHHPQTRPPVHRPELAQVRDEPAAVHVRVDRGAPRVPHALQRQHALVQLGHRAVLVAPVVEPRRAHLDGSGELGPDVPSVASAMTSSRQTS